MADYKTVFANETIRISKRKERDEFWLYDSTRGMNLSMNAKSEQDAFVESLMYYQKRLKEVESEFYTLRAKVDIFIDGILEDED